MSKIIFRQCHATNYQPGRTQPIQYIVIHYTANNGDTAKGNSDYFARTAGLSASAHYFVDEGDTVYQAVKDHDTAWHCGGASYRHKTCRNYNAIGIEMCSRKDSAGKYYIKPETVANAVQLTKELMKTHRVPIENVIRHYDVTGKNCPAPFVEEPEQWEVFKDKLVDHPVFEPVTSANDLVYILGEYSVITDKPGFIAELEQNMNGRLYWLCRKAVQYIREKNLPVKANAPQILTTANDIVYFLGELGIVSDKEGFLSALEKEPNGRLYWAARKLTALLQSGM